MRFKNYVNDVYLNSYNADGIIISTPTGSTGYSLSAGGPIVSPSAEMTIMTPVAPHTLNTRSVIFPAEDVITVEIGKGRHNDCEKGLASFDGDSYDPHGYRGLYHYTAGRCENQNPEAEPFKLCGSSSKKNA